MSRSDNDGYDRPVIHADPDIQDLIPGYLENRRQDLHTLRRALQLGDYHHIRSLAHIMTGSGGGYGFDAITQVSVELEAGAKARDPTLIANLLERLLSYLDRVIVVYEEQKP